MKQIVFFGVIVCVIALVLAILPHIAKTKTVKKISIAMLIMYAVANLYYTLLSRISLSTTRLWIIIADILWGGAHKVPQVILETQQPVSTTKPMEIAPLIPQTSALETLQSCGLNVLLYIPLGVLLPCVFPRLRNKPRVVAGIAFCISLLTELIQLVSRLGMCDIKDLLANTLGTIIGLFIFKTWLAQAWIEK